MSTNSRISATPPNQLLGLAFGAVYVLVGAVGFAVSAGHGFADTDGGKLLGIFEVNALHNLVHIAIGAALITGARTGIAKAVNATVGATYLAVGLLGIALVGSDANLLALNAADNVLHIGSAALLIAVALMPERAPA